MAWLILVGGLMGSGKSTLAKAIAILSNHKIVRSDEVRKELAQIEKEKHEYVDFDTGIYSPEFTKKTYERMCVHAKTHLSVGDTVILDACFTKNWQREIALRTAQKLNSKVLIVECVCPEEIIKERLIARKKDGTDIADGRWEIFAPQKASYEEIKPSDEFTYIVVDTGEDTTGAIEDILEVIKEEETKCDICACK